MIFVFIRPKGLSPGWSAALGGALAFVLGIVTPKNVLQVASLVWDPTLAFVAAVVISLVLDRAGFFSWAALSLAHRTGGEGKRLFLLVLLLGAAATAVFNNDGAILILTPIVLSLVRALGFSPGTTMAFLMAEGFIIDAASLPFPVSNLTNILSADTLHIGFLSYTRVMLPVDVITVLVSLLVLFLFYRRAIPLSAGTEGLPDPKEAILDSRVFGASFWVLGALFLGYGVSEFTGVPVSLMATGAALFLLVLGWRRGLFGPGALIREAPWSVIVFSLGMYLLVFGLRNQGLLSVLQGTYAWGIRQGSLPAILVTGSVTALTSALVNNLPSVMAGILSLTSLHLPRPELVTLAYANVLGADIGPKMSPLGSLATLIWLHRLEKDGIQVGWGSYVRAGIALTLPVLLTALLALWALSSFR